MASPPPALRRYLLGAALLALAAALATAWPAASAPTRTILCNYVHPDCLSNQWLLVWVAEQLRDGATLLHNDRYYWPVGDAPWLAGNANEGFPYAIWHLLLGWPAASNVHLLLILVLNGLGAYALARSCGASAPASLAAAPTGTLLVYCIQEMGAGRFTQVSVCWLAFFLASWMRFLTAPSRRRAAVSGTLLAITAFFYWYYGFFGVIAGAVLWGGRMIQWRMGARGPGEGAPPRLAELVLFSVVALALIAPVLTVFLAHWGSIPGTDEGTFPHPEAFADSTFPSVPFLANGGRHAGRALPFTTCVLALVGVWTHRARWQGLALLGVGLLFAALMAGTLLPHGPYTLLYGIAGPLRRFWWPYRHVVVLNLVLIALAARGASAWMERRPWVGWLLALSVPVQLEMQRAPWRAQFSEVATPVPFYQEIASDPGEVLLEPPLSAAIANSQAQLIYQLDHKKQLLGGHAMWVDRVRPPAWEEMVTRNTFLHAMTQLDEGKLDGTFRFDPADLRALVDHGVREVVLNREYFPLMMGGLVEAYEQICSGLFGPPVHTARRARAWSLDHWNGATEVAFTPWTWPAGVAPGDGTLSIQTPPGPSLAFSVPAPPGPPQSPGRGGVR